MNARYKKQVKAEAARATRAEEAAKAALVHEGKAVAAKSFQPQSGPWNHKHAAAESATEFLLEEMPPRVQQKIKPNKEEQQTVPVERRVAKHNCAELQAFSSALVAKSSMYVGTYGDELKDLKHALRHLARSPRKSCMQTLQRLAAEQGEDSFLRRAVHAAVNSQQGALVRLSRDTVGLSMKRLGMEANEWPAPAIQKMNVPVKHFARQLNHFLLPRARPGDNAVHTQLQKEITRTKVDTAVESLLYEF